MTPHPDDTITARSSPPGAGARAIVRITGPKARQALAQVFTPAPSCRSDSRSAIIPGSLRLSCINSPLPAEAWVRLAPDTLTGQDLVEIHTISSTPLVERLITELLAAGTRAALPGEFTQRAFLAGKLDLTRAEAVMAVIDAGTDADLRLALTQLAGGVSEPLTKLRSDLLDLLADVEAALDFVEEDIEFVSRADTHSRITAGIAHLVNLRRQLNDRVIAGRAIRVALVGRPNAGKSSLFNALTGSKAALVDARAGTTRDYLVKEIDLEGIAVELIDTAGRDHARDSIEEQAQRLGREQTGRADVILWCVPAGEPFQAKDENLFQTEPPTEIVRVATKSDLASTENGFGTIACNVVTPHGLDELRFALTQVVRGLTRPSPAPSRSRCRGHVDSALEALRRAHVHVLEQDPPELLALALRESLEQIGAMTGAVHTNDLLDRIFSRFCIGK